MTGMKQNKAGKHLTERQRRIYEFLAANPVGVLSTVDPNGQPHGVVIYYCVAKDFLVFFLTRTGTKKYDNLKHHNRVMLTVFDPKTQTTTQIAGRATAITDRTQLNRVADSVLEHCLLQTRQPGSLPITKVDAGSYVAFKIKPTHIRMATYSKAPPDDYGDIFDSIESFELEMP
jgi:general stress protein 26